MVNTSRGTPTIIVENLISETPRKRSAQQIEAIAHSSNSRSRDAWKLLNTNEDVTTSKNEEKGRHDTLINDLSFRMNRKENPSDTSSLLNGLYTSEGIFSASDESRSTLIKKQLYDHPCQNVFPAIPAPSLSIEALKELSKERAAKNKAIATRIMHETGGARTALRITKPKNTVSSPGISKASLLSIEELKHWSEKRSHLSKEKEIAARIIAEDSGAKHCPTEKNRYSCPAKKMGPAHNEITAFFNIPPGSSHGLPLICSHALCRKGRVKFFYCRYCKGPVSRMKFDERHAHPEQLLLEFADTTKEDLNAAGKEGGNHTIKN